MSQARALDLAVVAVYMLASLLLGVRFRRQSSTAAGFAMGSRAVPSWAIGLSVLGTFVSSISFVGNPGKSYTDNWAPLTFALAVPLVAIPAGRLFVPLYRRRGIVSAYAFLEERFGYWARAYGSLSFVLIMLGRVSVILYLVALVIAPMLGMTIPAVILAVGIAVTFYTVLGGMEAVIWTDVMQVVVMLGGAAWCLADILWRLPGGPVQVFAIALEAGGKFSLGAWSLDLGHQTFLGVMLFSLLANVQNFGIDQNYVQRYLTAKSDAEAQRAVLIAAVPYVPMTAMFLAIGTGLFAFYTVRPELLPAGITGDMVFPHFIRTELPAGISGLLAAAILAAAMSTVSSNLNCMATVIVEDFYRRHWRPQAGDREQVRLLRSLTSVWGLVGTAVGLTMIGHHSGLDLFWEICALIGSGLLGIFILATLPQEFSRRRVQWATALAVLFVLWGNFSRHLVVLPAALRSPLDPLLVGALGTALLVVAATVRLAARSSGT